jgi:hypothetical protein
MKPLESSKASRERLRIFAQAVSLMVPGRFDTSCV